MADEDGDSRGAIIVWTATTSMMMTTNNDGGDILQYLDDSGRQASRCHRHRRHYSKQTPPARCDLSEMQWMSQWMMERRSCAASLLVDDGENCL